MVDLQAYYIRRRTIYAGVLYKRTIYAGVLYKRTICAGVLYTHLCVLLHHTQHQTILVKNQCSAQNFRKNLFKINALSFFGRNAQNALFDFGHWEIL